MSHHHHNHPEHHHGHDDKHCESGHHDHPTVTPHKHCEGGHHDHTTITPRNRNQDFWDELQDATQQPISDEDRTAANQVIVDQTNASVGEMIKEINSLVRDGNNIDTRLLGIANLVANAKLPSAGGAKDIRDAYVQLLWNSRSIAGSAKSAADDFRGDMLDLVMMEDVSAHDKILELQNWNDITLAKGQNAIKQPAQFKEFVTRLEEYGVRIAAEISNHETEGRAAIAAKIQEIKDVNAEIKAIMDNVVVPLAEYLQLDEGSFQSIINGTPEAALVILMTAVMAVKEFLRFKSELEKADTQRRHLETQRNKLEEELRDLEHKQAILGDSSAVPESIISVGIDTTNFANRMTTFTNIFTKLSNDQEEIQKFLRDGVPVTDPLFKSKVNTLRGILAANSSVLDIYARAPISN